MYESVKNHFVQIIEIIANAIGNATIIKTLIHSNIYSKRQNKKTKW